MFLELFFIEANMEHYLNGRGIVISFLFKKRRFCISFALGIGLFFFSFFHCTVSDDTKDHCWFLVTIGYESFSHI